MAVSVKPASQKEATIPFRSENGVILPIVLLQKVREYLQFLKDNFPLTCRLWNGMLPRILNLGRWTYVIGESGEEKDRFLRIFQRYQQQSQLIVGLDLTRWDGLTDDSFI